MAGFSAADSNTNSSVSAEVLGQVMEDNLAGLVDQAQSIDTDQENVMGAVLSLSQDTSKNEAVNSSIMKTFGQYAKLPIEAARSTMG